MDELLNAGHIYINVPQNSTGPTLIGQECNRGEATHRTQILKLGYGKSFLYAASHVGKAANLPLGSWGNLT